MRQSNQVTVGVIGGSGLYELEGLSQVREHEADTRFGTPSDVLIEGMIGDVRVLFLPRHGRRHTIEPAQVPYLANMWAMKKLGAQMVLGFSAVGALVRDFNLGDFILPKQATAPMCQNRPVTFFTKEDGVVVHLNLHEPFCPELRDLLHSAAITEGICCRDGSYVCIPGPHFSTSIESEFYRNVLHCQSIGMTNFPEYLLARMACLPYQAVQMVTDYDNLSGTHLNSDAVVEQMRINAQNAKRLLLAFVRRPDLRPPDCDCTRALDHAIATPEEHWSPRGREEVLFLRGR